VISIASTATNEDNLFGFLGLSCHINTCYDEIYATFALVKERIQSDLDPPYSLLGEGFTERSGASVKGII